MKKTYKVICLLIFIIHSIVFSSSLINNLDKTLKIAITPSWVINPYYNYSIYKGSLIFNSSKWCLFVTPVVTNKKVGKQILGTEFNRFGLNGRIINAYIKYNSGKTSFLWGRTPVQWGQSNLSSIIHSDLVPTYDHGLFELR